jgi:hypothetical protein
MTQPILPTIRNRRALDALTPKAREQRRKSLRVLSAMREDRSLSLSEAARREGIAPESVHRYAGPGLERHGGRWKATRGDRLYRPMVVYSNGAVAEIDVRGSRKASELSAYHSTVRHFLDTGDENGLRRFEGKRVAGAPYETDPSVLEEMARRGQLDVDSIYQLVT